MNAVDRLAKLRAMALAELAGRAVDRVSREWERRTSRIQTDSRRALKAALRPALQGHADWQTALLAARHAGHPGLFASLRQPAATAALLRSRFPGGLERSSRRADGLVTHQVELFGQRWPLGERIDWHIAPGQSSSWPLVHHTQLPITGREAELGDVKDVWELNRHQFLVDLGKAWLVSRSPRHVETLRTLVLGWIDANPVGFGVNWAGPLEVAYRALSWTWAYGLVRDAIDDEFHLRWLGAFQDHGAFLYRHLERYSSPYNHLIGQASVLYLLGLWGPEFAEAPRWRRRGREVLETTLASQFHRDGGSVEQATVYHHATLGFYLLAALAGRDLPEGLSKEVWAAIERATTFSAQLTQPDGRLPAIGDNDDAWPILFDRTDIWDYRHFASTGATLFDRPDLKYVAGRLHEETVWLLGPDAAQTFDSQNSLVPPASTYAPESGYAVFRTGWNTDADYACFDCGELAGGLRLDGIASAVHGHADCLSVVLSLAGSPVLVDGGLYTYNGSRDWERHFRETAAHNTLRVDGRDQARHVDRMAWSHTFRVHVLGCGLLEHEKDAAPGLILGLDTFRWADASHDGYSGRDGARHRRAVLLGEGYLVIADQLDGSESHDVEAIFHFAPELVASVAGGRIVAGANALIWRATFAVDARVQRGGKDPIDGWVAPALGHRLAVSRAVLRGRSAPPNACILSVVIDTNRWEPLDVAPHGTLPELALRSRGDGHLETIGWPLGRR